MDEKDEIKSKLDLFANSILDIKCLSQEERDRLFEIEKDIILYVIKNKINSRRDMYLFNNIKNYIEHKINRSYIPNEYKIKKLYKLLDDKL